MKRTEFPHLPDLLHLRHTLHRSPELSGQENNTAKTITDFLVPYQPDQLITGLGGTGVAAVFEGINPTGPTVLFRAELDGLPIQDKGQKPHASEVPGQGHLCGHDGHMTILAGLAVLLHQQQLQRGKVVLLFQPAEETGAGAWTVLQDERFLSLQPDYVFALHNIPGFTLKQVVLREKVFAAASTGLVVELTGRPSHAAEPEKGHSPGLAMAALIQELNELTAQKSRFQDLTLLTVIHARLGEIAFGTSPGYATVMATLRAYQPEDFEKLKQLARQAAETIAAKHQLQCHLNWVEEFPATLNNYQAVAVVKEAATQLGLDVQEAEQPFRWSEDFGHFTHRYRGALFGLGAGLQQPPLHDSTFDFPDDLIPTGAQLFYRIAANILNP